MAEISSKSNAVFTLLFFFVLFLSFVNGSKLLKGNDDVLLNSRVKEAEKINDQVPSEQPRKIVSIVDEVKEAGKMNDQDLSEQLDTIVSVVDKKRFNTRTTVNNGSEVGQVPDYIKDLKDMIEEQTKIIRDLNKKVTLLTQHSERSGNFASFLFFLLIMYFLFMYWYSYLNQH